MSFSFCRKGKNMFDKVVIMDLENVICLSPEVKSIECLIQNIAQL
jgi:hypothetical protein